MTVSEEQVSKLLFQIQKEIEDMERELKEKEDHAGGVKKAVLERERSATKKAKDPVVNALSKLNHGVWLTECCDAPTRGFLNKKKCSECKQENPETYNVEKSVEDIIDSFGETSNET